MGILASCGELTPAELAQRVLTLSYFHRVSADDLRCLLRHLIEIDHIEVTESGGLIVGLAGERVTNSFKFYAVFQENEEFTVRCESAELGTIVNPPPAGERIAIAGHCWLVEEVDWKRHLVYCTQIKGRVPAYFGDCAGDINTHILERMKRVLEEHEAYPYLMGNARARLAQARHVAQNAGIVGSPGSGSEQESRHLLQRREPAHQPGRRHMGALPLAQQLRLPRTGAPAQDQMRGGAGAQGTRSLPSLLHAIPHESRPQTFFEVVAAEAEDQFDPIDLVYPGEVPYFDKYDEFLPQELVRKGFAEGVLDIEGMRERVVGWRDELHRTVGTIA